MENWLFALVVLGVGVLLVYVLDRMRHLYRLGQVGGEMGRQRRERNRWLTYWFSGRFPTRDEEEELEREVEEAEEQDRERELERRAREREKKPRS